VALAIDKRSGQIVWRSEYKGMSSYAAAALIDVQGSKQLVVFADPGPIGMDPATGRTLWLEPWKANSYGNGMDPTYRDGHLFISSYNRQGCMMLRLAQEGSPTRVWENKDTSCYFQPPIVEGDTMYLNAEGILKCFAWPSGKLRWATPKEDKNLLGFGGSLLRFGGDRMILLSQNGRLTLAKVTPERFEQLTSIPGVVEGRQVWATPLIYNGKLYVKGENEFVCLDIAAR
jgi:outer membrane protein assembly factor BamB